MKSRSVMRLAAAAGALALTGAILSVSGTGEPVAAATGTRTPLLYGDHDVKWYNDVRPGVMMPQFLDWDGDGERDVIDGGRVFVNEGSTDEPYLAGTGVSLGLPEPEGVLIDWDLDGDHDFLARYSLRLYENTGADSAPSWVDQGVLLAGGDPMPAFFADYNRWNLNHSPSIAYVDWDGDGDRDLVLGATDRVVDGSSTIIYSEGALVLFENTGTDTAPVFATGRALTVGGVPLNVPYKPMIAVADWNEDGEVDVLYGDYRGDVWFAERAGAELRQPVRILRTGDVAAWLDVFDRDGDGDLDLIVTSTYGMLLVENVGTAAAAVLEPRGYVLMAGEGRNLHAGLFHAPYVVDWDGDGDFDLVVGDENGRVSLFENEGIAPAVDFGDARPIVAGGVEINFDADDAIGSWEWGPAEAAAGYSNPIVVDWDADGDLDIITQDAQDAGLWFVENSGSRTAPVFEAPVRFDLDGEPMVNPWRTRVAAMDWDGDGRLELLQVREDYRIGVFARAGSDTDLELVDYVANPSGTDVAIPSSRGGRTNLQAVDWDLDGRVDLLQGGYGVPALVWHRNVGTSAAPLFESSLLRNMDGTIYESNTVHTPKTFAVDWDGDGILDLIDSDEWGFMDIVDGESLSHVHAPATIRRLEAESLPVVASSGDPLSLPVYAAASGGAVLNYEPNADGDFVTLDAGTLAPGMYDVAVGMRVAPNRGTVQLAVNGVDVGSPVDPHDPVVGFREFAVGTAQVMGPGPTQLRFTVTGKNPASGSRAMYIDYIHLTPIAIRHEIELLPRVADSAKAHGMELFGPASGGALAHYRANAIGDYVAYAIDVETAGTYGLVFGTRVAPNRAIVQVTVEGDAVGAPIDAHSTSVRFTRFALGSYTFDEPGVYEIRLSVMGKNASSNTYAVYADYFDLIPE